MSGAAHHESSGSSSSESGIISAAAEVIKPATPEELTVGVVDEFIMPAAATWHNAFTDAHAAIGLPVKGDSGGGGGGGHGH